MTTNPESNAPTAPVTARTEPMPVLPLRDVVVYPHMVIPLFVGREKSILALEQAMTRIALEQSMTRTALEHALTRTGFLCRRPA